MQKQSPKSAVHPAAHIALLSVLLMGVSGAALSQTVESLPVYHVVTAGASPDQVSRLATSLSLSPEQLTVRGGAVRFMDRDRFAFVPHKFVGGPGATDASGQESSAHRGGVRWFNRNASQAAATRRFRPQKCAKTSMRVVVNYRGGLSLSANLGSPKKRYELPPR